MSTWDYLPCFFCNASIQLKSDDFYDYMGKKFCTHCFESLSGGNYMKQPPPLNSIETQIPKSSQPHDNNQDACNAHQKQFKFFCNLCRISLCLYCIPNHCRHGFIDLMSKSKELLEDLHVFERILRYSLTFFEDRSQEITDLIRITVETYEKAMVKSKSSLVSFLLERNEEIMRKIQEINKDFCGLSNKECKEMMERGRDLLKVKSEKDLLHWCEWNDRCIHVLELETMLRKTALMNNHLMFPLFCRSATLPHSQVLVCGGRKAIDTMGLPDAYIIHLTEDFRVEVIDKMNIGRSNHFMLYFNGFVYIIGGCDSQNQFCNKCERLNLSTLKWEMITSCNEAKDTCSASGNEVENCIYVFGGRASNHELTRNIERYDVLRNTWKVLFLKMPYLSSVLGSIFVTEKQVLLFGGQDKENKPLRNCYLLDLESGKLIVCEDMFTKGGCIVSEIRLYRNKVYAYMFQGYCCRLLESFDLSTQKWNLEALS